MEVGSSDIGCYIISMLVSIFFSFRRKDVVKYLIQAGGDLNMQARDGCKALDLALVIVSGMSDSSISGLYIYINHDNYNF